MIVKGCNIDKKGQIFGFWTGLGTHSPPSGQAASSDDLCNVCIGVNRL